MPHLPRHPHRLSLPQSKQVMEQLTRREESLLRSLRTRHGRKDTEYCLCDGLRASSEILAKRPDLVEMLILREDAVSLPLPEFTGRRVVLPAADFDALAVTVHSQGVLVLAGKPEGIPLNAPCPDPFILVLDRVGDPGNFGTILRTVRAAGLHELWITKGSADPFSDKVVRSASGAQFAVSIRYAESLDHAAEALKKLGYGTIFRTLPAGGENIFTAPDVFTKSAVVLGCEATGVSALENSRGLNIPMPGDAESLNVAQAATIVLFEYVRRICS